QRRRAGNRGRSGAERTSVTAHADLQDTGIDRRRAGVIVVVGGDKRASAGLGQAGRPGNLATPGKGVVDVVVVHGHRSWLERANEVNGVGQTGVVERDGVQIV